MHRISKTLPKNRDDLRELRVTAGLADRTLKLEVFVDAITACAPSGINCCQLATDARDFG